MWDDAAKKGTASQEYIKGEERKLLDIIDRKAKKREEEEAKRKREHPIKPFKLDKKQTVATARLTPDGKYVILVINNESDKAKKTIVPNYVTEAVYTDTIPGREKVGDAQPPSRIAVVSTANGEVKWFDHGLKPPTPAEKESTTAAKATTEDQGKATEQKTEKSADTQKESTQPKEREVNLRAPIWSEDGKHAFVVVRSSDNKDAWIMAFDPATAKGRIIVTMHDDAWLRFDIAFGWLADNATIYYTSEATGFMHLYEVGFDGGAPKALTSGKWEVDTRDAVGRQEVVLPHHQRRKSVRAPPLPDAGRRRRIDEADVDARRQRGGRLAGRQRHRQRLLVHEQTAGAVHRIEARHDVARARLRERMHGSTSRSSTFPRATA